MIVCECSQGAEQTVTITVTLPLKNGATVNNIKGKLGFRQKSRQTEVQDWRPRHVLHTLKGFYSCSLAAPVECMIPLFTFCSLSNIFVTNVHFQALFCANWFVQALPSTSYDKFYCFHVFCNYENDYNYDVNYSYETLNKPWLDISGHS